MTARELESLARDRRLASRELHLPNDFYGHAAVIRRYAGWPQGRPLKVGLEHGVGMTRELWEVDLQSRLPVWLCASPSRARLYERRARGRIGRPIGPMIRYARALGPLSGPRPRLLVFPAHSTSWVDARYDVAAFIDRLKAMERDWSSVTVCLYWKDVVRGVHHAYMRADLECVTAGHMYDPDFLDRLRGFIESADAVTTNDVGSSLVYALALGLPAWVEGALVTFAPAAGVANVPQLSGTSREQEPLIVRIRRLFPEPRSSLTEEQRVALEQVAGFSSTRSSRELRAILEDAERRYRLSYRWPRRLDHALRGALRPLAVRAGLAR